MECIMRNIKLPDWFTMLNAVMGFGAAFMIYNGRFDVAAMLIIIATFLDGVDGAVARRFESGDFGEQLDSFADIISFGFVPALLLSTAIKWDHPYILLGASILFFLCGMLRLTRFSVVDSGPKQFEGIPITHAGVSVALMIYLYGHYPIPPEYILICSTALSLLMVSTVNYPKPRYTRSLPLLTLIFIATPVLFFVDSEYTVYVAFMLFSMMIVYLISPLTAYLIRCASAIVSAKT